MGSFNILKTVLITFGPFLLPRLLSYYRSFRNPVQKATVIPSPPHVNRALNLLFATAVLALISTLPYFHPENIFVLTNSRLQIPNDVLWFRLPTYRELNPSDEILKGRFVSMESRLLYFQYGPDPLTNCRFCNSDNPKTYYYYALASILTYHILHIALLGIVTSSLVSGREGSRWRTAATIAGVGLAAMEVYLVGTYNHKLNLSSTRLQEIDFFHWRMRVWRGIVIALVDASLALVLWASATKRAFVGPVTVAERVESNVRILENINRKLQAVGIARNVVCRDDGLRNTMVGYWSKEGEVVRGVFEQREVIDSVNTAVSKMDIGDLSQEAGAVAESIVGGIKIIETPSAI